MIFIAILLAAVVVYVIQSRLFSKHSFDDLRYRVRMSTDEVFEGEDIFLYEELENGKTLPLPNARVEAELPEGLSFRLHEKKGKKTVEKLSATASSVFVLHGGEKISRRWRVKCGKRGVYHPKGALIIVGDLFGTGTESRRIETEASRENTVTVLPRTINLQKTFTVSDETDGDETVPRGLLTDPTRICGAREYTDGDPMNRINWKSTAAHGRLMVNEEEYTEKNCFNLILNLQSRPFEQTSGEPSDVNTVELCITVVASVLDALAAKRQPVRLFANVPTEELEKWQDRTRADAILPQGKDLLVTREFVGKEDTLDSLRLLAALPMRFSCRAEEMMDLLAAEPALFSRGGNLVFVSSYLDERMIVFHDVMKRNGVRVSFFVTGGNRNAVAVPDGIPVAFRTHTGEVVS